MHVLGVVLTAGSCREGWGRRSMWQGQDGRCRITCRSLTGDKTLQQPPLQGIGGRGASIAAFPQQLPLNSWGGEVREGFLKEDKVGTGWGVGQVRMGKGVEVRNGVEGAELHTVGNG